MGVSSAVQKQHWHGFETKEVNIMNKKERLKTIVILNLAILFFILFSAYVAASFTHDVHNNSFYIATGITAVIASLSAIIVTIKNLARDSKTKKQKITK